MSYEKFQEEALILRDHLALDRTRLANERTLLAYVRTAIMFAATGVTLIKLFPSESAAVLAGWSMIPVSVAMCALGTWRFFRLSASLNKAARGDK